MAKSYVPGLARRLQQLSVYVAKHQATMKNYTLTTQQAADLVTIQSIAADFAGVQWRETP